MRYVENSNVNEISSISKLNLETNGNIGKMYQQKDAQYKKFISK